MKKARQLMQILSYEHTKPIKEKYAIVVLQIATLEERISVMMSFGMVDKAKAMQEALVLLLEAVRKEFIDDEGLN
jgi:hypothetical protein